MQGCTLCCCLSILPCWRSTGRLPRQCFEGEMMKLLILLTHLHSPGREQEPCTWWHPCLHTAVNKKQTKTKPYEAGSVTGNGCCNLIAMPSPRRKKKEEQNILFISSLEAKFKRYWKFLPCANKSTHADYGFLFETSELNTSWNSS